MSKPNIINYYIIHNINYLEKEVYLYFKVYTIIIHYSYLYVSHVQFINYCSTNKLQF